MSGDLFGKTADGDAVHRIEIAEADLSANILTYGATVQDLRLKGHPSPLVLGFGTLADYAAHGTFFGAIVGRYANRIHAGRFTLDGERFQTNVNDGDNLLHGGDDGYWKRVWLVEDRGPDFVTLTLHDSDGAMGFPGAVDVKCTYRIKPPGVLSIELEAACDRPTLLNLAHHSYFNLDDGGMGDVLDHRFMSPAQAYLPVDAAAIPTGVVQPVDDTPFDFRQARPLRFEGDGSQFAYDHNLCVAAQRGPLALHGWVQGGRSGVEMEVWSTEPGLQFYTGDKLRESVAGLSGEPYSAFGGLCLEPQIWPDSPNHGYFPQAVLRPGETYRQHTEYRFRLD